LGEEAGAELVERFAEWFVERELASKVTGLWAKERKASRGGG